MITWCPTTKIKKQKISLNFSYAIRKSRKVKYWHSLFSEFTSALSSSNELMTSTRPLFAASCTHKLKINKRKNTDRQTDQKTEI